MCRRPARRHHCDFQTSVTTGTIFQNTRKPLRLWFRAMWCMANQKYRLSAAGLQRVLGLGSRQPVWMWLHNFRRAMVCHGWRPTGRVEADETCLGEGEEGVRQRKTMKKGLIVVAAQEDREGIGRNQIRQAPATSAASLHLFVGEVVSPDSIVYADGWEGSTGLNREGHRHEAPLRGRNRAALALLLSRVYG